MFIAILFLLYAHVRVSTITFWLYFQSHHKKDPLKPKRIRLYTKTGQNGK